MLRSTSIKGVWQGKDLFGIRLVTDDEYLKIQGILTARKTVAGKTSPFVNFLGKMLVCEHCKGRVNLSSNTSHGRVRHYYRCCKWVKKACDAGHQFGGYVLEFHLLNYIGVHPDQFVTDDTNTASKLIEDLSTKQIELTKRINKLIDIDEDIPELKEKLAKLQVERKEVVSALEVTKGQLLSVGNPKEAMDYIKSTLIDTPEVIDETLIDVKKRAELQKVMPIFIKEIRVNFQENQMKIIARDGTESDWLGGWDESSSLDYPTPAMIERAKEFTKKYDL